MFNDLTRDRFAEQLNTDFLIRFTPEASMAAELVEVSELRQKGKQESYSLVFRAPLDAPVLQQMFAVEHPELGVFELFLVPIGKNDRGVEFEAVFNQLAA